MEIHGSHIWENQQSVLGLRRRKQLRGGRRREGGREGEREGEREKNRRPFTHGDR